MRRNRNIISQPLRVYLLPEDLQRIIEGQANSPCRSISEYCRLILAGKPGPQYYRNKSFDDFMGEAILLRKELQELREKKPSGDVDEKRLISILEQIKETINRIADLCM